MKPRRSGRRDAKSPKRTRHATLGVQDRRLIAQKTRCLGHHPITPPPYIPPSFQIMVTAGVAGGLRGRERFVTVCLILNLSHPARALIVFRYDENRPSSYPGNCSGRPAAGWMLDSSDRADI